MIIFLNNRFVDEERASISIRDAGFLFGEGVFTTFRLYLGAAPDLEGHWRRLKEQTRTLGIPFQLTLEKSETVVKELVDQNKLHEAHARMRITVTRGDGTAERSSTLLATVTPLPPAFDAEIDQGIHTITLGPDYLRNHFPRIKSLNCLPSQMALGQARQCGCEEAIILDNEGNLTEGAISNVFLIKDGELFTPGDNGQILPGRTRKQIIRTAGLHSLNCHEKRLSLADLQNADEVLICNSIRQVVPVVQINDQPVNTGMPGPLTMKLRRLYSSAMENPVF